MARACEKCGASIPWGAPQCVDCGSYTLWRSRLATLGLVIGGGTVLVVVVSLARVWLGEPPQAIRAAAEVQELFAVVGDEDRAFLNGAGRCKPEVAEALCVQTTTAFESLRPDERREVRERIEAAWRSVAENNPDTVVFVDPSGVLHRE